MIRTPFWLVFLLLLPCVGSGQADSGADAVIDAFALEEYNGSGADAEDLIGYSRYIDLNHLDVRRAVSTGVVSTEEIDRINEYIEANGPLLAVFELGQAGFSNERIEALLPYVRTDAEGHLLQPLPAALTRPLTLAARSRFTASSLPELEWRARGVSPLSIGTLYWVGRVGENARLHPCLVLPGRFTVTLGTYALSHGYGLLWHQGYRMLSRANPLSGISTSTPIAPLRNFGEAYSQGIAVSAELNPWWTAYGGASLRRVARGDGSAGAAMAFLGSRWQAKNWEFGAMAITADTSTNWMDVHPALGGSVYYSLIQGRFIAQAEHALLQNNGRAEMAHQGMIGMSTAYRGSIALGGRYRTDGYQAPQARYLQRHARGQESALSLTFRQGITKRWTVAAAQEIGSTNFRGQVQPFLQTDLRAEFLRKQSSASIAYRLRNEGGEPDLHSLAIRAGWNLNPALRVNLTGFYAQSSNRNDAALYARFSQRLKGGYGLNIGAGHHIRDAVLLRNYIYEPSPENYSPWRPMTGDRFRGFIEIRRHTGQNQIYAMRIAYTQRQNSPALLEAALSLGL